MLWRGKDSGGQKNCSKKHSKIRDNKNIENYTGVKILENMEKMMRKYCYFTQ